MSAAPPPPVPLAQEAPWRIVNFARDAGVERRMVFDLAFETNNTAWFAISDGLYRYDGYRWRRFTKPDGLPSSFIRSVTVTRDGSVWVGTDQGAGVFNGSRFDRRGTEGKLAGPNVRRIVETSDGALWFCCDRWPDATQPAGLTRRKGTEFQTFGTDEGLPSDHLLSLFEQSNGRLIALTANGPAVWAEGKWSALQDEGYPVGDYTWAMAEAPDGLVFAQAYNVTLVLREGRWTQCHSLGRPDNSPFCVTRDGAVIKGMKGDEDKLLFARWDGHEFVQASAGVFDQALHVAQLRQAPDGAVWAVGRGTLLRWEYEAGLWEWRPDLPRPLFEDREHRLWFGYQTNVVVRDGAQEQRIEGIRPPLIEDGEGSVWGLAAEGVARWQEGGMERVPPEVCGVATLRGGAAETSGAVWLHGRGVKGGSAVATCQRGKWKVFDAEALGNRRVATLTADPRNGVWLAVSDDKALNYEIARATAEGVGVVPIDGVKPRTHGPLICVSSTHLYLYGYNGLWGSLLGDRLRFEKVEAATGGVFNRAASIGDATAFISQEGVDGNAAILLHRRDGWHSHRVAYGQELWLGSEGWLLVADGAEFVLWETRTWPTPSYVSLPTDATITAMLRTHTGDFWLGTSLGVLHLRPGPVQPETLVVGPENIVEGTPAALQVKAVSPFVPSSHSRRYSYSWRLDDENWSGYGDWPKQGFGLAGVPAGRHRFQARARDGLGNEDPTPATFDFVVRPPAIQDRRWFRPALAAMGLAFALLSIALYRAGRRLRQHASGLEEQVQARTAQLREDIARRERSEKLQEAVARISEEALSARTLAEFFPALHQVIAGLMPARNFYVALVDRATETISFPYFQDEHDPPPPPMKLRRGLTEYVLHTGQPLLASAAEMKRLEEQGILSLAGALPVCWLGVPLRTRAHTVGIMVVQSYSEPVRYGDRERDALMLASYPVAHAVERKQTEEALRESHELRRTVLDSLSASIAVLDPKGAILAVNGTWREFARQNGLALIGSAAEGANYLEVVHKSERDGCKQAAEIAAGIEAVLSGRQPSYSVEYDCHSPEQQRWFVMQVLPLSAGKGGAVISHENITHRKQSEAERQKLQTQLNQSQKMESVGRLAGGVAHDFNNMLQVILGNVTLALLELPSNSPVRDSLLEVQKSAQRSAELTRQLLAFARKQTIAPKILDLNETVGGMLKMLRRLIGEDIDLVWMPGADLWPVKMDSSQIDQILANLCVNARDAIAGTGKVTLETRNATLDAAQTASQVDCPPGDYVMLSVSDTGHGMDAATRAHLFEPFFTTKEVGKGTGLGLATVFGIVKQNSGAIDVISEPGRGTTFKIYLPRVEPVAQVGVATARQRDLRGTETVLLVEDEDQVLALAQRILQQHGYTVLAACSPEAAMKLAEGYSGRIDLLITDVVMPGMNGRELHARLAALKPGLRCLFMSGYTADVIAHHGVLDAGVQFLQKPFTNESLAEQVREALRPPHET